MELVTEPDIYCPSMDDIGNYIDHIPPFVRGGIRCPCGSRKNQVYDTRAVFSQHIKSIAHKRWLAHLNLNRANYYIENKELAVTIQQQRLIIARLEKEVQNKHMTIDFLTQQLTTKSAADSQVAHDLLEFD